MLSLLFGFLLSLVLTLVVYAAYMFVIAFTLWMAVDAAKQDRFWWLLLVIGIPFVGSLAYFFTEKKHEYARAEPHHIHTSETEEQHEVTPKKLVRRRKKAEDAAQEIKEEKTEEPKEVAPESSIEEKEEERVS